MRAHLPLRLIRAAAFSVVCVTLAVLGHMVAGGSGPGPWAVAAGGSAVMAMTVPLAGRERSMTVISTGLLVLQLSLHELFALGDAAIITSASHPHARGLGESLGMLIAHLTATLITGWWLARGESALWALLRSARRRLGAMFRPPHPPVTPQAPPRPARVPLSPAPAGLLLRHSVSRRGPPLRAA